MYNTDTRLYPFAADAPWVVLNQDDFWRISRAHVLFRSHGEWGESVSSRKNGHYDVEAHRHIRDWLKKNAVRLRSMCVSRAGIINETTSSYPVSGIPAGQQLNLLANDWIQRTPLFKAAVEEQNRDKVVVTVTWPDGHVESTRVMADRIKDLL